MNPKYQYLPRSKCNNGYIEIDNYGGKPGTDIDKTCGHLLNLSEEQVRRKCNDNSTCEGYSMRKFGGNPNFRPWCLKNESENSRIEVTNEKYYKRDSGYRKFPRYSGTYIENATPPSNINCGKFTTHNDIRNECDKLPDCKGYTLKDNQPWCLKRSSDKGTINGSHIFYKKYGSS